MLFRNGSDGRFTAVDSGLEEAVLVMGANYGDLDNDGFVDVYLEIWKPGSTFALAQPHVSQ